MRCLAITYGTEGDSRPLAALCHALAGAGHAVHLLADAATLDVAHALGVPATALAGDIRAALARDGGMRREDGCATAVAWIERIVGTERAHAP